MIFILRVQGFSNVIFFPQVDFFVSKIFLYTGFVLYFTNMTENERKRENNDKKLERQKTSFQ